MTMEEKYLALKRIIASRNSLLVAFSGGVDSALLLKVAFDTLGEKTAACTALSPTFPETEQAEARQFGKTLGVRHYFIEYDELEIPGYAENGAERCYLCKTALFSRVSRLATEKNFSAVAYGANLDDLKEYRPGMKAAGEFQVSAPLLEAGFSKAEIRALAKKLGLPLWDKPALACLSSRIPSGTTITLDRLRQVERAESVLREAGFRQCRVRHHDTVARIEIPASEIVRLEEPELRRKIVAEIKAAGYRFVTVDLEGYRAGSVLEPERPKESALLRINQKA